MILEEEFIMIREIAKEVELTEGRLNISEISRRTGYDRKTVLKSVKSPNLPQRQQRKKKPSILDPYRDYIKSRITEYPQLSAQRIHREIQEDGFPGSYTLVKEYIRSIRPKMSQPAIYRFETKPGKQAQVDWGNCGRVEIDDGNRPLYCFGMILGYSRMRYVEFTLRVDVPTFIQCHVNALQYFGGVTESVLYDNLKQVVIKRAFKGPDSKWHDVFDDFSKTYGFKHHLCRVRRPQTKGKVENLIKYVKNDFFLGSRFSSFQDLNNKARGWMERVNHQVHGTTHEIPYDRLSNENLTPFESLPVYHIIRKEPRKISRDCYISYLGNHYSVLYKYAGRNAEIQIKDDCIKVCVQGKSICEHEIQDGSCRTIREKEHFKGLLAEVLKEPVKSICKPGTVLKFTSPEVEQRNLNIYEAILNE